MGQGLGLRIALAAALTGAVATAASVSTAAPAADGTVAVRVIQDWTTFDVQVDAARSTSFAITSPGYDRLVSINPKGGSHPSVPYLATSWKQTAKAITFTLRRDAKCTDGHVLTALDVLNSIKRFILVEKRSGSVASNGVGGWGPGPFHLHANKAKSTVTIRSDKPWRNWFALAESLPVICPAGLAALRSDPHALETKIYGSGPYEMVSATHGDQVVWKLRPEWHWGPPGTTTKTMPQTLVMKIIGDTTTAANQLLTGALDYGLVEGDDVNRLVSDSGLTRNVIPNFRTLVLVFNMQAGRIFADPSGSVLREAIMAAVNRQSFNLAAFNGAATVTPSVFRPGSECFDPSTAKLLPKPDLNAAKAILTKAGFTYSGSKLMRGGQPVKVRLLMSQLLGSGSDYIYSVFNDLGLDVDYQNLPQTLYSAQVVGSNFDASVFRGQLYNGEPGNGITFFTGDTPANGGSNLSYTAYQDATLQNWMKAGLQNPGVGGCKYFSLVQKRLLQQHYVMPLVASNQYYFARKGIYFPPASPDGGAFPAYFIKMPR